MISADFVHSLRPCKDYPLARLQQLLPDPVPLDIAIKSDAVPLLDRIGLLCKHGVLSDVQRAEWMSLVVSRAVSSHALACGVPVVERWARQWLSGEDRSVAAARTALETAAWSASAVARTAPWAIWAAWAACAAWYSARTATWYATSAAAEAAAWATWVARDHTWTIASNAENERQIIDALTVLRPKDVRIEVDDG